MLVSSISVGRKRKALSEVKSEAPVLEVSLLAAVDASCAVLGGGDGAFIDGTTKATVLPEERLSRSAGKTRGKTLMVAVATCTLYPFKRYGPLYLRFILKFLALSVDQLPLFPNDKINTTPIIQ